MIFTLNFCPLLCASCVVHLLWMLPYFLFGVLLLFTSFAGGPSGVRIEAGSGEAGSSGSCDLKPDRFIIKVTLQVGYKTYTWSLWLTCLPLSSCCPWWWKSSWTLSSWRESQKWQASYWKKDAFWSLAFSCPGETKKRPLCVEDEMRRKQELLLRKRPYLSLAGNYWHTDSSTDVLLVCKKNPKHTQIKGRLK